MKTPLHRTVESRQIDRRCRSRYQGPPVMTWLRDLCPQCSLRLVNSRFDTTFRMPDGSERLCFAIPAALCTDCHQLYLDPDLIDLLDIPDGRCVFAIESDVVLTERAA
jgi:hypothetical protein